MNFKRSTTSMAIALMALSLVSMTSIQQDAFAQTQGMSIMATADKGSDTITVTGETVSNLTDVTFRVTSPSGNNVVAIDQISPDGDGNFVQEFKIMTAGSYRRGKSSSGDMDIMLCSDNFLLSEAIEVLISRGLIIDILALDKKKFMGVAQIPGNDPFRIDIFMVSKENWWVAMVTHTGPKELNKQMRTIATTMGMKLSDQGLKKGTEKIPIKSEADLFRKLNMEPIKPTKR